MLISNAEIAGLPGISLRIEGNRITQVGPRLQRNSGEAMIDARGGALIPGLHDHHIHLHALAAARASVPCGPPHVRTAADLAKTLARACHEMPAGDWIRGTGYHESVAGELSSRVLDEWTDHTPVRIQHRSGALWVLNTAALNRLPAIRDSQKPGIERDSHGVATGRLFRLDDWLREQLGPSSPPDLGAVSEELARYGITGATDATPTNDASAVAAFADAAREGRFRQKLSVMGKLEMPEIKVPGIERTCVKIMLDDERLPELDHLHQNIEEAHAARRCVAIHCVTRGELVFATEALAMAGVRTGDRIEHAAVTPPELMRRLAELSLQVVTQHGFLYERGDVYAREVDLQDQPWLYRGQGFIDAHVPLGGSTDAPFGAADPWRSIQAAARRKTEGDQVLEPRESLPPETALALFTTPAETPGGASRRVAPGQAADLCILDRPWSDAREILSRDLVAATICSGEILWQRP